MFWWVSCRWSTSRMLGNHLGFPWVSYIWLLDVIGLVHSSQLLESFLDPVYP
jgi:hypothetical protein